MSRDFFKRFLQVAAQGYELTGALSGCDPLIISSDESIEFCLGYAILAPGVISRLDLNRAQSNDGRSSHNPHVLTADRGGKPFAQVLFRLGDRKGCHKS